MRLSSVQIFQQGISAILDQQSKVAHTEQQLATGLRILTPSDDPVGTVRILDITEDLKQIEQYQRNGDLAEGQLALEETVLTNAGNLLQRVRELVVQANNASQTPETRQAIAVEIASRIDELQGLANTRDASGEYIFAGYQSETEAFSRQGGTFTYNGDDGQRFVQLASSSQVAVRDSGFDVFMSVPNGNGRFDIEPDAGNVGTAVAGSSSVVGSFVPDTYTITFSQPTPSDPITYQVTDSAAGVVSGGPYVTGETITFGGASVRFDGVPADNDSFEVSPSIKTNMFTTLQNIVDNLNDTGVLPSETAALNNAMAQALNNIDQALGHVSEIRTSVGGRLNHVENQKDINESFTLQLEQTLSGIKDLDLVEAISTLNLQITALQAAQQAYVKVQGLSLFNYL